MGAYDYEWCYNPVKQKFEIAHDESSCFNGNSITKDEVENIKVEKWVEVHYQLESIFFNNRNLKATKKKLIKMINKLYGVTIDKYELNQAIEGLRNIEKLVVQDLENTNAKRYIYYCECS